jgi:hypothetical protein
MAVYCVGVELCGGWEDGHGSATTVPELLALARGLGRLLALAAGAATDRAHLDSTRSLRSLSL